VRFETVDAMRLGVDRTVAEDRLERRTNRRRADEALAAGVDAADLVVVGPERHQAVEVAATHRFVERDLDVVGGCGGRGRRLRSRHGTLRLIFRALEL